MKTTIISMVLLALIGATGAFAQSGSKGTSADSTIHGIVLPAPVGHRQPRASDFPNNVPNSENNPSSDATSKEDAVLDKKMKSICRGC